MKIIVTFIFLFSMHLLAQPWQYDFGTETGSFTTANATATNFLPNPPAGGGFAQVRVGSDGGGFELDNPGSSLGDGSELQITASTSNNDGRINKFSISDYDASQFFSVGFSVQFQGGIEPNYGAFYFFIGDGEYYGDDSRLTPSNVFNGLRFGYSDTDVSVQFLNGAASNFSTFGAKYAYLAKNTTYSIELFGNNSATDETYTYNGEPYILESNGIHLFINGSLIAIESKPLGGLLADNSNIDSYLFMGGACTNNGASIYLDDLSYSNALPDGSPGIPGSISGTVTANSIGLEGVEVELTHSDGFAVEGVDPIITDANGSYEFLELDPANYQVGILIPLGYALDTLDINPTIVNVLPSEMATVNFHLDEAAITYNARGRFYWKGQFTLHLIGWWWIAKETETELLNYIDNVHQYYTPHFDIFDDLNTFEDWNDVLRFRLHPSKKLERAKAQVAALVLNFTSLKISQNIIVTEDNRTAGDVLTYCSILISNPNATNTDLRLAKLLAWRVNQHQMIGAGIVPDGGILYKGFVEKIDWNFGLPTEYELSQNYPNPFNPTTKIKYRIPESSFASLNVYDVLGNEIATLVNEEKFVGSYEVEFNATELPSGIYFYRLQAGSFVETKKMMLLK